MNRRLPGKIIILLVLLLVFAQPARADDALLRSLIIPGLGQAQRGNYGKAALFAGAAVVSGVGIFISQIHYNRAADRFNDLKRTYIGYEAQLAGGEQLRYEEIQRTYRDMQSALDRAESRYAWRNVFLVTLVGSYAINLVDIALTGRPVEEREIGLSLEMNGDSVRIVKCLRF